MRNICRSPIAEAIFLNLIEKKGLDDEWKVDSAAIGEFHIGSQPDKRARNVIKKNNIEYSHKVRLLCKEDFREFDYIFGMDENNIKDINEMKPKNGTAKVDLLGKYDPQNETIIVDPYYDSGSSGFEHVFHQCVRCCTAFLDQISEK
ncbi:Low molecular weight phosphotyrosine protein phosphatase 2 [Nymphon striatum]|nr:Low molecular weight phosphotyrosine protein phosphatase 2 [Nymphon striatum]